MSEIASQSVAQPLTGGRLLAEITSQIVALLRKHYGKGPIRAKTYVLDNLVVVVLSNGFTAAEQTALDADEPDRVLGMRRQFQEHIQERYVGTIEELTGLHVRAFLSQTHLEPDLTVEMFLMDGPLRGFGAVEVIEIPH